MTWAGCSGLMAERSCGHRVSQGECSRPVGSSPLPTPSHARTHISAQGQIWHSFTQCQMHRQLLRMHLMHQKLTPELALFSVLLTPEDFRKARSDYSVLSSAAFLIRSLS